MDENPSVLGPTPVDPVRITTSGGGRFATALMAVVGMIIYQNAASIARALLHGKPWSSTILDTNTSEWRAIGLVMFAVGLFWTVMPLRRVTAEDYRPKEDSKP